MLSQRLAGIKNGDGLPPVISGCTTRFLPLFFPLLNPSLYPTPNLSLINRPLFRRNFSRPRSSIVRIEDIRPPRIYRNVSGPSEIARYCFIEDAVYKLAKTEIRYLGTS